MEKERIELKRDKNFPFGYSTMDDPRDDSEYTLNKIIAWSKKRGHSSYIIYLHKIRIAFEKVGELGFYTFKDRNDRQQRSGKQRCHKVVYLDIYYQ